MTHPIPSQGPQGNDKAPGEDPAGEPGNEYLVTQKGKKVDADPSEEKDKPVTQEKGGE